MKPRLLFALILACAPVASAVPSGGPPYPTGGWQPGANPSPTISIPTDPAEVERELAATERHHRELEKQLRLVDREDELVERRAIVLGRAYVRASRAGLLPVAGGFEAFVDHAAEVERLRKATARELATRRQLSEKRTDLRRQQAEVASRLAVLRTNQRALAEARSALLAQRDRAAAFRRAFSTNSAHTAVYGSSTGPLDPNLSARGFAAMKGSLPFPIAGRTEITRADRPGVDGPGLELQAPIGTPVHAVFPGRVAFADEYGVYGRTVIIDHGNRYFTVSAGLGDISVEVRDEVAAGERIGAVGLGPHGSGLYFEIREGAETIEPDDWMGL